MKNQSLIINDNDILYEILNEISDDLNFSVSKYLINDFRIIKLTKDLNYLVLTKKVIPEIKNQILIKKFPLNIFKLIEIINIEFLKLKFNEQSQIKIGHYFFDLNAREMINRNQKLKLTEKEIASSKELPSINDKISCSLAKIISSLFFTKSKKSFLCLSTQNKSDKDIATF